MSNITNPRTQIPQSIQDSIFRYRFQKFLKDMGKTYSGSRAQLIERIEDNLQYPIFHQMFMSFLVDELGYGKTRQIFISRFDINNLMVLKHSSYVETNLAASGLPSADFNHLLKDDVNDEELVYLQIDKSGEKGEFVKRIKMCFYKEIQPAEEYADVREKFTDYIWVEIIPEEQLLLIRIRPHTSQFLINFHTSKRTHGEIFSKLQKIFPLNLKDMFYTKEVLYTIFKELTEIAEQPYRESIVKQEIKIDQFLQDILPVVGIPSSEFEEIKTRYIRLLERSLIINDLDNYQSYHQNRIGIIERISLTDLSGATANVLSGDSDGLDVADFYFDIRETIDNMGKLDKLWVKWFLAAIGKTTNAETEQIEFDDEEIEEDEEIVVSPDRGSTVVTRFEVTKDYVVINFMKELFVSKEVQDYVLSRFIEFEEKTNQQS